MNRYNHPMIFYRAALIAGVIVALASPVRADPLDKALEEIGGVVRTAINRTRRDIVIGPTVGGAVGVTVDEGELTSGVSFGLAVYVFESPSLREIVKEEVKTRVKELARAALGRGEVPDLKALVRRVIAELRGRALHKGLLDPPRFGVALEGMVVTSAGGGGQVRVMVSKGVGKISLGAMLGVARVGGEFGAIGAVEASLRLTPIGTIRTPVVEPFVRVDAALQSELPLTVGGGLRLVADVF